MSRDGIGRDEAVALIVKIDELREQGVPVDTAAARFGVSSSSYFRWRKMFGVETDPVRKPAQNADKLIEALEEECARLKKAALVAALDRLIADEPLVNAPNKKRRNARSRDAGSFLHSIAGVAASAPVMVAAKIMPLMGQSASAEAGAGDAASAGGDALRLVMAILEAISQG